MDKVQFVVQDLLSKIYQRQFPSGKLPTQRDLARQYGVSRFTVQTALKNLGDIGVVESIQGSGVFVRDQLRVNPLVFNSLTRAPYSRIVSKCLGLERVQASPEQIQVFHFEERAPSSRIVSPKRGVSAPDKLALWRFERVRIVNGTAEQIETSFMPISLFPDLSRQIIEKSIQGYVEAKGFKIFHFMTSYEPIVLERKQAEILGCKRGRAAMHIQNRGVLSSGRVFELSDIVAIDYSVSYIRPYDREIHRSRLDTQKRQER